MPESQPVAADEPVEDLLLRRALLLVTVLVAGVPFLLAPLVFAHDHHPPELVPPLELTSGTLSPVLVLHSYDLEHPATAHVLSGIDDVLAGSGIGYKVELLDSKDQWDPEYQDQLLETLRAKHHRRDVRVLLACDDAAFAFAVAHREQLAPGAQLAASGLHRRAQLEEVEFATGIVERAEIEGTAELIRRLQPDLRRLHLLTDATLTSREALKDLRQRLAGVGREPPLELSLADLSWSEVEDRLRELQSDEAVLFLSAFRDKNRVSLSLAQAAARLSRAAERAPIYTMWEHGIREGFLGGKVITKATQRADGQVIARQALRMLAGERAAAISIAEPGPTSYCFNRGAFARYALSTRRLPPDSHFLDVRASFYEEHPAAFWAVVAVSLLLASSSLLLGRTVLRLRQTQAQLLRQERRLAHARRLEAIGTLAGGVAHDFNNLLTVINANAELLQDAVEADWAQEAVADVRRAGDRASQLTRKLLTFARRRALEPQQTGLNSLISGVVTLLERAAGSGIELEWRPAPDPELVALVDGVELEQALVNLVVNARDAMGGEGRIVLGLEARSLDELRAGELGLPRAGEFCVVSVSDEGPGIDAETQERLFEPFFTTKQDGTGLGLAMVHGLVLQSGGAIAVHSQPGQGARFELLLPRSAGLPPGQTEPPEGEDTPSKPAAGVAAGA